MNKGIIVRLINFRIANIFITSLKLIQMKDFHKDLNLLTSIYVINFIFICFKLFTIILINEVNPGNIFLVIK